MLQKKYDDLNNKYNLLLSENEQIKKKCESLEKLLQQQNNNSINSNTFNHNININNSYENNEEEKKGFDMSEKVIYTERNIKIKELLAKHKKEKDKNIIKKKLSKEEINKIEEDEDNQKIKIMEKYTLNRNKKNK